MPPRAKTRSGTRGQIDKLRADIDALLAAAPAVPSGARLAGRADAARVAGEVAGRVRRRPLAALAVAFLAGFIAGKLA